VGAKVLVLNADYQAIGVCAAERAFVLVFMKKAEMLAEDSEKSLRTIRREYKFPSIIRLYRFVAIPYKRVNLTRQNVFKRDNHTCVYCGTRENLTIDHVLPRSNGGRDSWENLVTACQKCNSRKGNQTPEQAEMQMSHLPFRPSFVMFLGNFSGQVRDDWRPYLYMN
jgi:5-methylcytosine-specific restriction endonuclease McrA